MNVEEAIRTRRSIGKVKDEPVPRELLERMLEAAVWAPNHHQTEPWKFVVMTGEGRKTLGERTQKSRPAFPKPFGAGEAELHKREEAKANRAPVVIAVVCSPSEAPRVSRAEEFAAANSAVQNLLLSAHASGLGAVWRSGDPMYHPAMKSAFGLQPQEELVGLVYVGYPDLQPPEGKRIPAASKTIWIEA
ncbi:nitroreductase family protein [Cohnella faecalis]|uniref:Putative NAD(P)H nitroreductase n=1 Tax=Cohnella faecalis TaxID=2315694 RepID=A0A398D024_9BACL|nr:nitroreductase [Cohnella faecalis]RIE05467.1 nitroreductase [Cohnella faecalis]